MGAASFKIKEFPTDGRHWRVDWLGALTRNPSVTTEPSFQVVLSPVEPGYHFARPKDLASNKAVDFKQHVIKDIGVGQLPLINIGSVWKDGVRVSHRIGRERRYNQLLINPSKVKIVRGDHKVDDKPLIPFEAYRFGGPGKYAWIAAVEHNGDPYGLLIPLMELIRFYYAPSKVLSHALFSGAYIHNIESLINPEKSEYDADLDRVTLRLRRHVADEDAFIIARVLNASEAWRGATGPNDAMIKHSMNQTYVQVESEFPFSGRTDLIADVKPIKSLADDSWRDLVMSLRSCSGAFPFDRLCVSRDNCSKRDKPENRLPDEQKPICFPSDKGKLPKAAKPNLQSAEEPNKAKGAIVLEVASDRFTAISGKSIEKEDKEQCRYRSGGFNAHQQGDLDLFGTGQGGYNGSDIGTADITSTRNREQSLGACFNAFEQAVEALDKYPDFTARLRSSEDDVRVMPLTKSAGYYQWSYLESSSGTHRSVVAADIQYQGDFYLLVEFEARSNESFKVALIRRDDGEQIRADRLANILFYVALSRGVWNNASIFEGLPIEMETLKHTWPSPERFAEAIERKILGLHEQQIV